MPPDLVLQIPVIQRFLVALGVPLLSIEGFEADDILATLARQVEQEGGLAYLVTSDKDCRQLLSDRIKILNLRKREVFDAASLLADEALARELTEPSASGVVRTLAEILKTAGPLSDREAFRAAAARVRERTGAKGRALFHPIRVALTGAAEGPELDILVPAVDSAADLPTASGVAAAPSCRARAAAVAALLARS